MRVRCPPANRGSAPKIRHPAILNYGYFENRLPFPIVVDEPWYLKEYPDVAQAVQRKKFKSAQKHFELEGFREGRFPYKSFALFNS